MKIIKRILLLFLVALLTLGILFVGVGYVNYKKAVSDVSIEEKVKEIREKPDYVKTKDISPTLIQATISIEDHRFYQHKGVDYRSLARALVNNIFAAVLLVEALRLHSSSQKIYISIISHHIFVK